MPAVSTEEAQAFVFNRQSIINAMRELQIDFHEGPKELVMSCFITSACQSGKRSLYLNVLDKPGVFHCFKCGERGYFSQFVAFATRWGEFKLVSFLRKHRPTSIEVPGDAPVVKQLFTEADVLEGKFAYRHDYCFDRGFTETTLRRYRIGYDREENDLIFPWYDRVGRLVAIKRRAILSKYYRFECNESITHLLFGLHLVRPRSIVWIAEGEFDGMYLDQSFSSRKVTGHGAVALGGKYLHSSALDQLLIKAPSMIVLALDNDVDGDKAASTIEMQLAGKVQTYRMQFESNVKDPNESSVDHIIKQAQVADQLLKQQTASEAQRLTSTILRKTQTT